MMENLRCEVASQDCQLEITSELSPRTYQLKYDKSNKDKTTNPQKCVEEWYLMIPSWIII